MSTKQQIFTLVILLTFSFSFGQVGLGTAHLGNSQVNLQANRFNLYSPTFSYSSEKVFHSKGILKVKPDLFVAIFSVIHIDKTVDRTNSVVDGIINPAIAEIQSSIENAKTTVDMIRFLPKYETQVQKKLFSKKTYKEIPVGFEIQKNIHVQFNKSEDLNEIISIMAKNEIYDFVKVDNLRSDISDQKEKLKTKVLENLKSQLQDYHNLTDIEIENYNKDFADQLNVFYPTELYENYQQRTSYNWNGQIQYQEKPQVYYFNTIKAKDYDVEMFEKDLQEPTIEIVYQASMKLEKKPEKESEKENKEPKKEVYYLNTNNGQLQKIPN